MSDKEKLIEMFQRAKIDFDDTTVYAEPGHSVIIVERGYVGFSTWFSFRDNDSLEDVEAGE